MTITYTSLQVYSNNGFVICPIHSWPLNSMRNFFELWVSTGFLGSGKACTWERNAIFILDYLAILSVGLVHIDPKVIQSVQNCQWTLTYSNVNLFRNSLKGQCPKNFLSRSPSCFLQRDWKTKVINKFKN